MKRSVLSFRRLLRIHLLVTAHTFSAEAEVKTPSEPAVMQAAYSDDSLQLDGRLEEPVWKKSRVYQLDLSDARSNKGRKLEEPGEVRLAWDNDHLYVGIEWVDRDLLAKGTKDHEFHFKLGDLCEVFLKHEGQDRYWELYGTPAGKRSCFWFEKPRARLQIDEDFGLRVAAKVDGTLNQPAETDRGWSAELAIPKEDLTRHGAKFGHGSSWRVLVARYNYTTDSRRPELSMTPKLSRNNYHLLDEHARLEFVR